MPEPEPENRDAADARPLGATRRRQPLSESVELDRRAAAIRNVRNGIPFEPRIDGHLEVYGLALDALDRAFGTSKPQGRCR